MSDFTWFNAFDGTSGSVNSGGLISITSSPGCAIYVQQNLDQPAGQTTAVNTSGGDISSGVTYSLGVGPSTIRANGTLTTGTVFGVNRCSVSFQNQSFQFFGINLTVINPNGQSFATIVLPNNVVDGNIDMLLRKFSSSILPQITGFKASDGPVNFAVIPQRGGTFVGSGINAVQITIRPTGATGGLYESDPLVITADTPDLQGSSPNQYYLVPVDFRPSASPQVQAWFSDMNALLVGGQSTGNEPAGGAVNVSADKLLVNAEIQITEGTGGSAVVTTSNTFQFYLYQSITDPSP